VHRQKPSFVHSSKQVNIDFVEAIRLKKFKDCTMVDCIEGIFYVKIEDHRFAFVPTVLFQDTPKFGELAPRAAVSAETLLCFIQYLVVFNRFIKKIGVNSGG